MAKYIGASDVGTMNYVIDVMISRHHLIAKHKNPFLLLKDYFVPALLKKYGPEILRDSLKLERLFSQASQRLHQIFECRFRIGMNTGKREPLGGLVALYNKAKSEGYRKIDGRATLIAIAKRNKAP